MKQYEDHSYEIETALREWYMRDINDKGFYAILYQLFEIGTIGQRENLRKGFPGAFRAYELLQEAKYPKGDVRDVYREWGIIK